MLFFFPDRRTILTFIYIRLVLHFKKPRRFHGVIQTEIDATVFQNSFEIVCLVESTTRAKGPDPLSAPLPSRPRAAARVNTAAPFDQPAGGDVYDKWQMMPVYKIFPRLIYRHPFKGLHYCGVDWVSFHYKAQV